jgi:hypothetical protein
MDDSTTTEWASQMRMIRQAADTLAMASVELRIKDYGFGRVAAITEFRSVGAGRVEWIAT